MADKFQDKLYKFVCEYLHEHGVSPNYDILTTAMGIGPRSKSLISRNLKALEKSHRISLKKEGKYLTISLRDKHIPLIGKISAGNPIEAVIETHPIYIETDQLFKNADYALLVQGTSMIEEGIFDGDIITCKKHTTAIEGDIIVALIDNNETTLKRISYKSPGKVTLIPANPELSPKQYFPEQIQIQGIYTGLIRLPN